MKHWTFTHAPVSNGAKSLCILTCGRTVRAVCCDPGYEIVAMEVLLKKENLL